MTAGSVPLLHAHTLEQLESSHVIAMKYADVISLKETNDSIRRLSDILLASALQREVILEKMPTRVRSRDVCDAMQDGFCLASKQDPPEGEYEYFPWATKAAHRRRIHRSVFDR